MRAVHFSEGWEKFFKTAELGSFEALFNLEGVQVNRNSRREVVFFAIDGVDGRREFFMKRFFKPHFKDILKVGLTFKQLCSQGQGEWRCAHLLLGNGIETYHPVCYGEDFNGLIEKCSFVITEKLPGRCMNDFLKDNWEFLSVEEKTDLFRTIGELLARIHNLKISLPDFYLWHIYTEHPEKVGSRLSVIDLHRMRVMPCKKVHYARDVGAFEYSVPDDYLFSEGRTAFRKGYCERINFPTGDVFWKEAEKRFQKQRKRRKAPGA